MSNKGGTECAFRNSFFFRCPKDLKRAQKWIAPSKRNDLSNLTPEPLYISYRFCEFHFENSMFRNKSGFRKQLIQHVVLIIFPQSFKRNLEVEKNMTPQKKINILSDIKIVPASQSTELSLLSSLKSKIIVNYPNTSRAQASTITLSDTLTITVDNKEQEDSCLISPSASTQTPAHLSCHSPTKEKLKNMRRKLACRLESITELKESSTLEDFDQMCDKFLSPHLANIVKIQATLHTRKARGRRYTAEYSLL